MLIKVPVEVYHLSFSNIGMAMSVMFQFYNCNALIEVPVEVYLPSFSTIGMAMSAMCI